MLIYPLPPSLFLPPSSLLPYFYLPPPLQAAEKEERIQRASTEKVKAVLAERGDDEEPEPELIAQCINEARVAEGLLPLPVAGSGVNGVRKIKSLKEDDEEEEGDDETHGGMTSSAPSRAVVGGISSSVSASAAADLTAATGPSPSPPPPRKVLTCVLFADTNTHVLLTGDDRGRVDVYRVVGLGGGAAEADVYGQHELLRSVVQTL